MNWEILSALIVIVGCLVSLGTVLAKLVITLTRLDETVKAVNGHLAEHEQRSESTHKKLYERQDRMQDTIDNHEIRIHDLEKQNTAKGGQGGKL